MSCNRYEAVEETILLKFFPGAMSLWEIQFEIGPGSSLL